MCVYVSVCVHIFVGCKYAMHPKIYIYICCIQANALYVQFMYIYIYIFLFVYSKRLVFDVFWGLSWACVCVRRERESFLSGWEA